MQIPVMSGKSIIVNAIGQLCGERGSPDMVRSGTKKAIIEAELELNSLKNIHEILEELDIDPDDSQILILRKELNASGASRMFINDSPINLSRLNIFSSAFFDFHGQHQHQRLLNQDYHLDYLDSFCDIEKSLSIYQEQFTRYIEALKLYEELKAKQHNAFQKQDMYRYQNEELNKADLKEDELDALKSELKILSNVENLHQSGQILTEALYSGDTNASSLLSLAEAELENLSEMDSQFNALLENLKEARSAVEEIGNFTQNYLSDLEFDPQRIEFIHQRIASLEFLLKKYQKEDVSALISFHSDIGKMLGNLEQFDEDIKRQEQEILSIRKEVLFAGTKLTQIRLQAAKQFEQAISNILPAIGMSNAAFQVEHSYTEDPASDFEVGCKKIKPAKHGFDQIIFKASTNAGEDYYPLQKIASGGEISRIMLAIKTVLAENDQTPVLIFDEIDSGISGRVAQIVGKNLSELGRYHQIICVTHLPQIAAFAGSHYKVSKDVSDHRTLVRISSLNDDQQIQEIAHLLGGVDLSDHAMQNARHLIDESRKL
ncbi:MAG: DNA repair protein RecN [Calditrichaceae bacterium]